MKNQVALEEINKENLGSYFKIEVKENQRRFVSNIPKSIAEAHFSSDAWFRGITLNDQPSGFIMLQLNDETNEYYIWRLLVDKNKQKLGIGRKAVQIAIEHVIENHPQCYKLNTTVVPGKEGPLHFYKKLGFNEISVYEDGTKKMEMNIRNI